MPALDPFTLKAMTLVTVYAVTLCAFVVWRINRSVPGIGMFVAGLSAIALGGSVGLVRLLIPARGLMIAYALGMLVGLMLMVQALRRFRGFRAMPPVWILVLLCAPVGLFLRSFWGAANLPLRITAVSAGISIFALDAAASMFRRVKPEDRPIYWPAGFAFAFVAVLFSVRGLGAIDGAYAAGAFVAAPIEMFSTICANVSLIACLVGMLLASNAQLRKDAQRLAEFDALTNLPNRRYFLQRLRETERRAILTRARFGVIFLDLDGFKAINDTLGHAVGDDVLHGVSAAMSGVLRAGDCLARIGGDEFVAIVEHVERIDDMQKLTARLRLAAEDYSVEADSSLRIRISCGAAVFPDDGNTAQQVMRHADDAMYRDKSLSSHPGRIALAV